eukprot:scaffold259_cov578-Prasinococcus_capsulatus_cf.AAC.9
MMTPSDMFAMLGTCSDLPSKPVATRNWPSGTRWGAPGPRAGLSPCHDALANAAPCVLRSCTAVARAPPSMGVPPIQPQG